jgi:hypothetical protein
MAIIEKHFEEVLGDIGVIKLWTTKFLGIPIYRKESLSERMTEVQAFQSVQRNTIGFKVEDDETQDKSEGDVREVQTTDNRKGGIYRFKIKRHNILFWTHRR